MKDYLDDFLTDLNEFKTKTMQFHNGELKVPEYKGFSGAFGSYAQRGGQKHMLRLRMPGGDLSIEKLGYICNLVNQYNIQTLKLTTCQCIQLHDIEASDLCDMIEGVWRHGMLTRGGGGDFPRNVMASPLSGVEKNENFNVLPYAKAASNFLMRYIKSVKFPRKLKVAFSSSISNETHATIRDLGFVARPNMSFDVYCCGGMGNNPKLGVKVAEAVKPSMILYYIDAMVRTFVQYGNYENRAKARTRYMQETLGVEGLKEAYSKNLEESLKAQDLLLEVKDEVISKQGTSSLECERATEQKQPLLYSVFYQPIGGMLDPKVLNNLYNTIKDMKDVCVRVTPNESLYVINLTREEALKVIEITPDCAMSDLERSVACVGASICQVGVRDSQELLHLIVNAYREAKLGKDCLPQIHISGCPSSCSGQFVAKIGFRGAVKPSSQGPKPAFAICHSGCDIEGKEFIAPINPKDVIYIDDIPTFIVELGKTVESTNMSYDEWIKTNTNVLEELIQKYVLKKD